MISYSVESIFNTLSSLSVKSKKVLGPLSQAKRSLGGLVCNLWMTIWSVNMQPLLVVTLTS